MTFFILKYKNQVYNKYKTDTEKIQSTDIVPT